MALKENLVCLDDPLLDHLVKMAEQDLPDHLDYLDDKELKESLVKMQSSTELFSQILHSPVHKDHQDLKGPLDSLVTLVCQVNTIEEVVNVLCSIEPLSFFDSIDHSSTLFHIDCPAET